MSKKEKILIVIKTVIMILSIILFGSIIMICFIKSYATSHETESSAREEDNDELLKLINEAGQAGLPEQDLNAEVNISEDNDVSQEKDEKMLTDEPVRLSDIYSESGSTAIFRCFDADAESYEWEYYDLEAKEWTGAEPQEIQSNKDELNRMVSCFQTKAEKDGFMVRCTMHFVEKEDEIQTASLFILKDEIKNIQADDFITDADTYISAQELPVRITYLDGSEEDITGLNDFYFLMSEEETDYSASISGNRIETTTLTTTECNYFYTGQDEEQMSVMRYRTETRDNPIKITCKVTGKDLLPPVISDITISPYEVSNIDKPVTLTVTILAEDDVTPYPELEYAFVYAEDEPEEADWIKKPTFDICIDRNGRYIAYSRDQAGNVSQMEKEIITVDTKAPVISSVSLANASGWCRSNTIIVDAQDAGGISYYFENASSDIASDWITFSEYSVDANGIWIIKVRDEAGNITETEIEVSNIDREAPVIYRISVK